MRVTIQANVVCTIDDPFQLMKLARETVESTKPREDWDDFYPHTPTEALQLLIREAIAIRLLTYESVVLHEIGHRLDSFDIPLDSSGAI